MAPEIDPMPALIIVGALVLAVLEIWRRGLSGHLPRAGHALVMAAGAAAMIAPFAYQLPIDRLRLSAGADPAADAALIDAAVRAGLFRLAAAAGLVVGAVIVLRRATRASRRPMLARARLRSSFDRGVSDPVVRPDRQAWASPVASPPPASSSSSSSSTSALI